MELRAALTNYDISRYDELAAEFLNAKPLRIAVAAVSAAAAALLVSHYPSPSTVVRPKPNAEPDILPDYLRYP
jgi:hypothetical protein